MLRIKPIRVFKRTVKASIPSETVVDGVDEASFIATFKALSRSEIDALQKNKPDDVEFLRDVIVGVEGLGDEEGNALSSEAGREAVIEDLALCIPALETFNAQYRAAKSGN